MQPNTRLLQIMGAIGALSGFALWALWKILDAGVLSDRIALSIAAFVAAGLGAHLALSGPLAQKQAGSRALLLGALTSLLVTLAALRYDDISQTQPIAVGFIVVLWHLALPFLISQGLGRGFRHYPTLYAEAWNLFERLIAAWIFVGLTWAVIYLSDLVLSLVGLQLLTLITEIEPLGPTITGAAFGLGLAVMLDIGGAVVPALLQRLLRLLLPILLIVVVLFIAILPFRGFDAVFGNLSAGVIFLVLTAMMATMVTAATGPDNGHETKARMLSLSARAMAGLMILPALLAIWALWLRVGQYGWTPERLAAALLMAIGLISAAFYLGAAVRPVWHQAIRRGNVSVALLGAGLAVFWVGVLPTEQIASRSTVARYEAGLTTVDALDIYALKAWGRPGAAALARLQDKADAGDTALAALLADGSVTASADKIAKLRAELKGLLPVQPVTATATRDAWIDLATDYDLQDWSRICTPDASAEPALCGVIVGDFLTDSSGEEVLLVQKQGANLFVSGFAFGEAGLEPYSVSAGGSIGYVPEAQTDALFASLMAGPPTLMPAPMNIIPLAGGIMFLPNSSAQ